MSGDEKKIKDDATLADKKVKATVEKIVEKKIVEHRVIKDYKPPNSKSKKKKSIEKSPTAKDIDSLQKQLREAETAREEAEDKLLQSEKILGTKTASLEEKESILQTMALKAYEEKKKILVDKVRSTSGDEKADEVAETIQSGEDLDRIGRWLNIFGDTLKGESTDEGGDAGDSAPKPAPKGKVGMQIAPVTVDGETFATTKDLITHVYDNLEEQQFLKYMEMPYDARKLEKYQGMADKLLKSLVKGESSRERYDMNWKVIQCNTCQHIMTGGEIKCPNCNADVLHIETGGMR